MLLNPVRQCPLCGAVVPNRKPVGKPFVCPDCSAELQLSARQTRIEGSIDIAIGLAAAWLLGFRGWGFAAMSVVFYAVALIVITPLEIKLWPTKLEPYKGGRIWG